MSSLDLASLRRGQILRSTVRRIAHDGVRGLKLKDIADDADVSLGLVQHYFRSRANLVDQAFEVMMRLSDRAWNELDAHRPEPLVKLVAILHLHAYGTVRFDSRWAFWAQLWTNGQYDSVARVARSIYARWEATMAEVIDGLVAERHAPDTSCIASASTIMAVIDGYGARSLIDPVALSPDAVYAGLYSAARALFELNPDELANAEKPAWDVVEALAIPDLTAELIASVDGPSAES